MFKSLKQLHWSIFALALSSGVIMTGFMMIFPLLPEYAGQLGFGEYDLGLLVAAFFVGRVLLQFPLGVLSDRVGRRHIMSASLLLFTVATAAFALTTGWLSMMVLRLLQGVAASGFAVASQSYINDRTPTELRGLANGVTSSAINIGVIAGPVLGGVLAQAFNIQFPFWIGGILGAICFTLSLGIPDISVHDQSSDWDELLPRPSRVKRVFASVCSLPSFSLSLVQFLLMMAITIFLYSAPILTATLLDWSSSDIALAFAISGAAAAISSPFLGQLSDRVGRIRLMAFGLITLTAQGLIVYFHPNSLLVMAAFALGGAGTPAYFNAFYSLIGDVTVPSERGAVTGFVGSFGEWGSIIGSSLLGPIAWRSIGVTAPMAADALVALLTLVLILAIRVPLQRQVGDRSCKSG
ncbi:MAG: MFS transporter [Thermoleophilia bacterium]|nr:MFS transporter [Thermoleophilia bacterium]